MELLSDRYQIQTQLGKKAGRQTFLAKDLETQELVVVKCLIFGSDFEWDDLKLFEREAETLKSLDHPAVPEYLDYFELELPSGKGFALVQSYIEAKSLEQHLKAGRSFTEMEVKQLAEALLNILIYLHNREPSVIHRDIKPSNILLSDRSGNYVGDVYLVDFGSVQTLVAQEGGTITVVGTYGYMPPEQYGGRATSASDLYSLGATLIYLVTGKHPANLPQRNLKLEFREFATVSATLIDWLEWLTEPGLENRLGVAEEALDALQDERTRSAGADISKRSQDIKALTLVSTQSAALHVRDRIFWNAIWRTCAIAVPLGGAVGVATFLDLAARTYYSSKAIWLNVLMSTVVGGSLFLVIGFLNGLAIGFVSSRVFPKLRNRWRYRMILMICTTLITTSCLNLIAVLLSAMWINVPLSILIANSVAALSSQWFAQWYIRETRDRS